MATLYGSYVFPNGDSFSGVSDGCGHMYGSFFSPSGQGFSGYHDGSNCYSPDWSSYYNNPYDTSYGCNTPYNYDNGCYGQQWYPHQYDGCHGSYYNNPCDTGSYNCGDYYSPYNTSYDSSAYYNYHQPTVYGNHDYATPWNWGSHNWFNQCEVPAYHHADSACYDPGFLACHHLF